MSLIIIVYYAIDSELTLFYYSERYDIMFSVQTRCSTIYSTFQQNISTNLLDI